ncbi:MAG: S8 family serine peptidase, partial [Pirellulales bacterium]|nr:S8 family serine peptidase [Pirellulales bacterium]
GQQVNPADPFPTFATWGADARVVPAWDIATGEGVVIGIVDNGLQYSHSDIAPNYNASLSHDFNGNDSDPMADPANGDFHGTSVAGIAAASGNNGLGIAGVAYDAALAGLRLIAGPVTDLVESEALTWEMVPDIYNDYISIDIYNNSWGPSDDVRAVMGPGPLALQALIDSVSFGRDGLGTIHVWAAGNGGESGDSVNYDGYASHRYTIAVGAYDCTGELTDYSEGGPALFVVAPSGREDAGILTTDLMGDDGYNAKGYLDDPDGRDYFPDVNYTSTFGGTSAAAPIVSGVIALMLEANPNLTYRDVEHILARSARQINPSEGGWIQNADPLFYDPWTDMDGLPFDPETRERYAEPDPSFSGSARKPVPADGPPFEDQHPPTDYFLLNGAGFTTHNYYGHGAVDAALAVELAQTWSSSYSALPERVWTICDT